MPVNTWVEQNIIGPYVLGEKPTPLQISFTDSEGNALDLTGFTAEFEIIQLDGDTPAGMGAGVSSIPDEANGTTQYVWLEADFQTAGMFRGVMWVGDGSQRYASEFFEWFIRDSSTTIPSI
jgi:hypothetical protein